MLFTIIAALAAVPLGVLLGLKLYALVDTLQRQKRR